MHDPLTELEVVLKQIARLIVDYPDEVIVLSTYNCDPPLLRIRVRSTDLGKMIGKQGRIARAIRIVVAAHCKKTGVKVAIDIVGLDNEAKP